MFYREKTFNHSLHKSKKFLKAFLTEKHKRVLFMSWKLTTIQLKPSNIPTNYY